MNPGCDPSPLPSSYLAIPGHLSDSLRVEGLR